MSKKSMPQKSFKYKIIHKKSIYAKRTDEILNRVLNPTDRSSYTTRLFEYDRIGVFEDALKKDACEWTKEEVRLFIRKFSRFYTKSTSRNHINLIRRYRTEMQKALDAGDPMLPKDLKVADDLLPEGDILNGLYFKKYSLVNHTDVDKIIGTYKGGHPMEIFLWMMTFYFAPTLKELRYMKTKDVRIKYITKNEYGEMEEYEDSLDKVLFKTQSKIKIKEAIWHTIENRFVDLGKPEKDNDKWKLNHAFRVIDVLIEIAMYKSQEAGYSRRTGEYIPCIEQNDFILRNQIPVTARTNVLLDDAVAVTRIPSMLAMFSDVALSLENRVSYSDLVYSHILYRICSLHEKMSDILNDENLLIHKHIGFNKGGKINESVIREMIEEYGYEEDNTEEVKA